MYSIFSEDGSWIIVFDGDDEKPEELTLQEFIDRYGEENLPARDLQAGDVINENVVTPVDMTEDVIHYWASFRRLCKACGGYAWADKLQKNDVDGVYPVQKVVYDTFGNNATSKLAIEVERRRLTQKACARNLNYWSQRVGFLPMREVDLGILIKHLYDSDFRSRMYYRIDKFAKKNELVSARELVIDVLQSFLKQKKRPT